MLKTTRSSEELVSRVFKTGNNEVIRGGSGRADKMVIDLSKSKNDKSKKLMHIPNIGAIGELIFLIPNAKKAFNYLRQAFIETPILRHFDPKYHIWIETDASNYAISGVLSQLNLDFNALLNDLNKSDFSQWYPIAYFFKKMISAKTQYETYNAELLAIVKAFKT